MKEKRIEKEIKKAQKKGIYNPKLKLGIVALILVIGTVIGVSYAYYTSNPSTVLKINATVSKKIMVRVEAGDHGKVNELDLATAQTDYGIQARFIVTPETNYEYKGVSCKETYNSSTDVTSKVNPQYSNGTLTIMPKTSKDVTCTVEFAEKKIKITVNISGSGGTVTPTSQTVNHGSAATFNVSPSLGYQYKSVSCSNGTTQYSNSKLTVTPSSWQDVVCTVSFSQKTLQNIIDYINKKAKNTVLTSADFAKGCPLNDSDECSGVYKMDDYSNSTSLNYNKPGGTSYYFRGEAKDNYVKFANNNWRIVRINGDGSIRLVLDGDIGTSAFNTDHDVRKYVGYTYDNGTPCTNSSPCTSTYNSSATFKNSKGGINSTIKTKLEKWYYDNLRAYDSYITYGTYCNDTSYGSGSEADKLHYGAYARLTGSSPAPRLTCPDPTAGTGASSSDVSNGNHTYGGVYKLKIGLLSADEIVLAGYQPSGTKVTESNYLYYTNYSYAYFWSSSPTISTGDDNNRVFDGRLFYRYLDSYFVHASYSLRPVINLSTKGLEATGKGAQDEPFVISQ